MLSLATLAGLFLATPALGIGAAGPDFSVTPVDGNPFLLSEATHTHAAVVVVFLSVICPYSNFNDAHLSELDAQYAPQGVLFVGVNSNRTETTEEMAEHARKVGQTFPMMKDAGNKVADLIGAHVTPEAFLFDHDGRLRYRGRVRSKFGATELKDALEAVLAGRPVKTPIAKAFGCTITRQ